MHSIVEVIPQTSTDVPVYDLTTVEAVNDALVLTSSSANDAEVATQITAASQIIATMCNRVFAMQTVRETFRIRWTDAIRALPLARWPIIGGANDITISVNGAEEAATSYEVDPDAGLVYRVHGHWHGPSAIVVEYTGGYDLPDDAPPALAQACLDLVRDRRLNATRDPGIRDVWAGENRVSYFQASTTIASSGLPAGVADLLTPFKRISV